MDSSPTLRTVFDESCVSWKHRPDSVGSGQLQRQPSERLGSSFDDLGQWPNAPNGASFAALIEHSVCGKAQLYFAGHNHAREWLEPTCGTTFIVSGAAAKLSGLWYRDSQPTRFEDDTKHGFLWAEIDREHFLGVFYDADGHEAYRDQIAHPDAQ